MTLYIATSEIYNYIQEDWPRRCCNSHNSVYSFSPYPPLPMTNGVVSPFPTGSLGKLSYDSPRYKLTPERAIPLIEWFEKHKEHPYPTRHEKILLCQSTQLTFTQVS